VQSLVLSASKAWAPAWPVGASVPHPDSDVEDPEQRDACGKLGLLVKIFQSTQDG
jgi:hypothetical protein